MARWLLPLLLAMSVAAPGDETDVAASLAALSSGDENVRREAAAALRATAPGREDVVAGITPLLGHENAAVRLDAINLLEPLLIGNGQGLIGRAERRAKPPAKLVTKESEAAVERALKWLGSVQDRAGKDGGDGRWACAGFTKHDPEGKLKGAGSPAYDAGITGLVLLAFLGAGYTNRTGPFRENVAEGLAYLRSAQAKDGCIGPRGDPRIVTIHAVATLALAEAWALTGDPELRPAAQQAVAYLERQQADAGWGYERAVDTHTVGCALYALGVARLGGLDVDPDRLSWGLQWLDARTEWNFGQVGYDVSGWSSATYGPRNEWGFGTAGERAGILLDRDSWPEAKVRTITCLAGWCRVLLSTGDLPIWLVYARNLSTDVPPLWKYDDSHEAYASVDFGYWAYGAVMLAARDPRVHDPKPTLRWFEALHGALLPHQRRKGPAAGSWDPVDAWGAVAGRLHATAMAVRALEAPYLFDGYMNDPRHIPKAHARAFSELAKVARSDPDDAMRQRAREIRERIKTLAPYK